MTFSFKTQISKNKKISLKSFKELCSRKLLESSLARMEENILVITTYKLEKIFPCDFFDLIEHFPIHIVQETRLGGPVQMQQMYPFES